MDINRNIEKFKEGDGKNGGRRPDERYSSFDFCYNYFHSFYKKDKIHELSNSVNLEKSCLQLGFYLASWGMMRGSSFLLEKSVRNYSDLIILISKMPSKMWEIDVDQYSSDNLELLLDCKKRLWKFWEKIINPVTL